MYRCTYGHIQSYQPFAQITVIDAFYGDSNVVDFAHYTDEDVNRDIGKQWRRILIDTGPPDADKKILKAIEHVLRNVRLPCRSSSEPATLKYLSELQITHTDEDHIGNAAELLQRLSVGYLNPMRDANGSCDIVFPWVPNAYVDLSLTPESQEPVFKLLNYNRGRIGFNVLTLTVQRERSWEACIQNLGLAIEFHYNIVADAPSGDANYEVQKDPNDPWTRYLIYNDKYRKQNPTIQMVVEYRIYDVEDGHRRKQLYKHLIQESAQLLESLKWQRMPDSNQWPDDIDQIKVKDVPPPLEGPTERYFRTLNVFGNTSRNYLVQLGNKIQELRQYYKLMPRSVSFADEINYPPNNTSTQVYVSPTTVGLKKMAREVLKADYRYLNQNIKYNKNSETMNRASVVTLFSRNDLGLHMLFTGDAFDRSCDIRETLFNWVRGYSDDTYVDVGILKVPHHGSQASNEASFYEYVTAQVYLISGSHHDASGNPRLATLAAIIRSIRFRLQLRRGRNGNQPFRMFFSSPRAHIHSTTESKMPSAMRLVLESAELRPQLTNQTYDYEMYRLKSEWGVLNFGLATFQDGIAVSVTLQKALYNSCTTFREYVASTWVLITLSSQRCIPIHFLSSGAVTAITESSTPPRDGDRGYITVKWALERILEQV
ncbi:hypothetical protein FE257_003825 [Aspergillus nanangensis]|uniref:Uncharacterized protein n=1 Tax=Aspergillus nanangensis TaxID=2582783 RepID=A0AAD4CB71_ASPNN|nr:hypothetical protein FE257_003825 [Aspergillus nanangensis]